MGKRSRQRAVAGGKKADKPSLRERTDAASRIAERQIKERPSAPWDPFPLTELAIFTGLVLLIAGAIVRGDTGKGLVVAGVVLACIGGLETIFREHLAGYRSHSGMLAGIAALATLIGSTAVLDLPPTARAAIAIGVFALVFPTLRAAFVRKSGGRGVL